MDEVSTLASRLQALRVTAGLSQTDVAKIVNCTPAAISYLECGRSRACGAWMAVRLARLFGVSVDYLLEGGDAPDRDSVARAVAAARAPAVSAA